MAIRYKMPAALLIALFLLINKMSFALSISCSDLAITSDPCAFATLNREFEWELQWKPTENILPGSQIELRSLNLRTFLEWQYTKIEIDKADIIMRRPIKVGTYYLQSAAGDWVIARAKLPYGIELLVKRNEPVKARIKMSTEDDLQSLEIISDKQTVWSSSMDNLDFDISVELGTIMKSTYFYLRALQRNGGIIYASPVFVSIENTAVNAVTQH